MTTVVDTRFLGRQNRQISRIRLRCGTVLSCHAAKHRTFAPATVPSRSALHGLKMSPAAGFSEGQYAA